MEKLLAKLVILAVILGMIIFGFAPIKAQSIYVTDSIDYKIKKIKDTKLHDVVGIEFNWENRKILLSPTRWYNIYKYKEGIVIEEVRAIEENKLFYIKSNSNGKNRKKSKRL